MREIKFSVVLKNDLGLSVEYGYTLETISNIYQQSVFEVVAVREFTGLKDKNGKEIYEGDVVELFNIREEGTEKGELVWQEEYAGFIIKGKQNRLWSIEMASGYDTVTGQVIGNIYENPNLLENNL